MELSVYGSAAREKNKAAFLASDIRKHWFLYFSGVLIPLLAYIVFIGYPLIKSILISFCSWDGLGDQIFVGLKNYKNLFTDRDFLLCLKNNLFWAVFSIIVPVGGGLVLAVILKSKKLYLGSLFRVLFFVPCTASLAATGIIFSVILNPVFGGLNEALRSVGLGGLIQGWLDDPNVVMFTLLSIFSWNYMGMPMIMFHAGLSQIEPELYEMAEIEGANSFQKFIHITIPLLKSVFTVVVLLVIISSLKAFDLVTVMTKGGPGKDSDVLAYFMYTEVFHNYKFGYGASIGVVILLLSIVFAVMYIKNVAGRSSNGN